MNDEPLMPNDFDPVLNENERLLIFLIRKRFQYSEMTIKIRGGVPYYIERTTEGYKLNDR